MSNAEIPVFILHGWAVDAENERKWRTFIDELDKNGVKAQFLPIPGLSTELKEVWDVARYISWLHSELQAYPLVKLVGHSFGGQLAVRFAALYPSQVSSLVLLDSSGLRDHSLYMEIKRAVFWAVAKVGKGLTSSSTARRLLYKLARERDYLQASPMLRQTMAKVITDEVGSDLPKIQSPTLIIWGKNDQVTPLKLGKQFAQNVPSSQLIIIEGARHSPQFTHPQQVARVIAEFLT